MTKKNKDNKKIRKRKRKEETRNPDCRPPRKKSLPRPGGFNERQSRPDLRPKKFPDDNTGKRGGGARKTTGCSETLTRDEKKPNR